MLVKVLMFPNEHSLFQSPLVPISLMLHDRAGCPINAVVLFHHILCHCRPLVVSIPAAPFVLCDPDVEGSSMQSPLCRIGCSPGMDCSIQYHASKSEVLVLCLTLVNKE